MQDFDPSKIKLITFDCYGTLIDWETGLQNSLASLAGVTKQSLNRVLRTLVEDGLVEARVGRRDKRERNLFLTEKGSALERDLSEAQRARMRAAYRAAGPAAVTGFRQVLEAMMDPEIRRHYLSMKDGAP